MGIKVPTTGTLQRAAEVLDWLKEQPGMRWDDKNDIRHTQELIAEQIRSRPKGADF